VHLNKFVIFPPEVVKTSINLPGVPTTISAPFLRRPNYPYIPAPPYIQATLIPHGLAKRVVSAAIYFASSLVGLNIIAIGPSPSYIGG